MKFFVGFEVNTNKNQTVGTKWKSLLIENSLFFKHFAKLYSKKRKSAITLPKFQVNMNFDEIISMRYSNNIFYLNAIFLQLTKKLFTKKDVTSKFQRIVTCPKDILRRTGRCFVRLSVFHLTNQYN